MGVIKTKVVGITHQVGSQTRLNALKHGHPLTLVRERSNQYDHKAVAVWDGGQKLGYVPKTDNRNLAVSMDRGVRAFAFLDGSPPQIHVVYPYTFPPGTVRPLYCEAADPHTLEREDPLPQPDRQVPVDDAEDLSWLE